VKIAICFDDLIQFGGAERLLLAVHELYPDAPIYTSVASDDWLKRCPDNRIDLKTSFMQNLPFKKSLNRFYGLLGLHALAFESFNFDDFDVVLSISARFAHGIITKPGTIHVCYMNSPGRMFWEQCDYFEREGFLSNDLIKRLFQLFSVPLLSFRRLCDYACAQRVDYFIANALTPKKRIKKYYRRESTVIYPFVDESVIGLDETNSHVIANERMRVKQSNNGTALVTPRGDDYYLVITRLNAWKRVDIAIEACKKIGVGLKIIGEGSDKARLLRYALVPPNDEKGRNDGGVTDGQVEFLGYVSEQEKISAILGCKALIVTQKEDFGITALEAMALGKPVIAYRAGGALETVIEGATGEFFNAQEAEGLVKTLAQFNPLIYKPESCKSQVAKFSKQKFMHQLDEFVKTVYDKHHNL